MGSGAQLKPGRLSITCIDANNIRGRAEKSNDANLAPYLLFKLNGKERTTKTGNQLGHDINFNDEVVSFDLSHPEDVELTIELRDDGSNGSVGTATFSISNVLASPGVELDENLDIINPGDVSTNSTVNLKFVFTQAKHGVVKLSLRGVQNIIGGIHKGMYAVISTPDGQSRKAALAEADNALGFWMDPTNWFGDFTIRMIKGGDCIGVGELSMLSCLGGTEIRNATACISLGVDSQAQDPLLNINHWFLEAGFVKVHSIHASNLRDVSLDLTGLANPRVIVKCHGKIHSTLTMTNAAMNSESNEYHWNDVIRLPVVDEYSIQVEGCEYDEVSRDKEPIGSAEVSLLPLFKTGRHEGSVNLNHVTELDETLEGGQVNFTLSFEAPEGAAFPRDQPTMTSYILGQSDTIDRVRKNVSMVVDDQDFSDESIQKAFTLFDLDKNGYIGTSELKHILIMMGEHVSDEEVDMMISMLDLNGDGQVSFKEFRAMAKSQDPQEDFLKGGMPERSRASMIVKNQNERADKKREAFSRCVETCKMDKEDVYGMWKVVRERARVSSLKIIPRESFYIDYGGICELLPAAFCSRAECRAIFDLLREGDETIDSRDLIMTFTNFVEGFGLEERCRLAFELFDVDHSGHLSLDEIEAMMMSTNLTSRDLVKKRADNFMLCADTDRSGGITIDELIVAAEKLPNLLYPPQTKKRTSR